MPWLDQWARGLLPSEQWGEFPYTVLHFVISDALSSDALSIDLREKVSPDDIRALTRLGFEQVFGILTAQNPMSLAQTAARNEQLANELQREVAAMGVVCAPLDACSPDRSHCERSIAVAATCAELVELARRYRQLAIFWFDGTSFWIIPAMSANDTVQLPLG